MSLTSAPVIPCSCADGWKPEGWAYCAECYEGQIERLRAALAPFAAEKMPALRRTKIDYDRYGLRRCISPMEIACRDAHRAISPAVGKSE
jgi:hypothetical protein